jgi:MEDS: MEthanogen/methylotroph, DcmR Sensory domain/STAS domain
VGPPRRTGLMVPTERFGLSDHASWAYDTVGERAAAAAAWLTDGLTLGQRAVYVADAPVDVLTQELADVPGRDEAIGRGALVVAEAHNIYDFSTPADAATQLRVYSAAVEQAIADGFAGIRVAADITPLVADPGRRRAHLHWEQFADRYITEQPLAPLCLYDRRKVGELPAIEHVHPLNGPDPLPFSLYGVGPRRSALVGEVDAAVADPFAAALAALPDRDDTIDVGALGFIDAHGAWVLQRALERRRATGRALVLHQPSLPLRRVWELCRFDPTPLLG